jgi:hypothetical protein
MTRLIITNGDSAASIIKASGLADHAEVVAWRDVLHDGPIPNKESLEDFSKVRLNWLLDNGRGDHDELYIQFTERNFIMHNHHRFTDVELWFEHDLFDQLQLIQVLDFFASEGRTQGIMLVQTNDFIAQQNPNNIDHFYDMARNIDRDDLAIAAKSWKALSHSSPYEWYALLQDPAIRCLTYLELAIKRMLQELPDFASGLTRTQRIILQGIPEDDETLPGPLFKWFSDYDQPNFMGDASFMDALDELRFCQTPLLSGKHKRFRDVWNADPIERTAWMRNPVSLTDAGKAALAGLFDHIERNQISRWWGGTMISPANDWRWDAHNKMLIDPGNKERMLAG